MASLGLLALSAKRLAPVLLALALLAGAATAGRARVSQGAAAIPAAVPAAVPAAAPQAVGQTGPSPEGPLAVPASLLDGDVGLRSGPVDVPLELQLPTIGVRAPVAGVGITSEDVMDAPTGRADDPVWQQVFWYRGSALPGSPSTALMAGHVNGPGGRTAAFSRIGDLRPGDPIVVRDTRTGLQMHFVMTEARTYSIQEARDRAVLARIYGAGPVAGSAPQPSSDGLAHLTLVTCAGTFRSGTHDHRLVVYATRSS